MTPLVALNPHAKVAAYAGAHYSYDGRLADSPLVEIPTRTIDADTFAAVELLRARGFLIDPRPSDAITAYLNDNGFAPNMTHRLTEDHFLVPHETSGESIERRVLDHFNRRYLRSAQPAERELEPPYEEGADIAHHFFTENTFFNLPRTVDPARCHVGLLGIPLASVQTSLGTVTGPDHLRLRSRSMCWFDVQKHGVYSEISLEGARPEILCRDVVLRDCGDLSCETPTLLGMLEQVGTVLSEEFFGPAVFPIIVGGDHAITYPIVRTYLEKVPDLGLLHLDAHNDLFYAPRVVYSHAAPISNLVKATAIERIASFGLRTFTDKRMAGVRAVYQEVDAEERLRLRSLTTTKRMVMDRRLLDAELDALADRPYYLTLDLDVLSESAIGRQVSTPFGVGLEWHELLTFLDAAFARLEIVGCDVVEYNGLNGDGREQSGYLLTSLLLLLIDRLAGGNPKLAALAPSVDQGKDRGAG